MNSTRLATTPPTPEEALELLRDRLRWTPSAEPSLAESLTFGTTIAEWCEANEFDQLAFGGWRATAETLEAWWDIEVSPDEWRAALVPSDSRTVRDLCELLARHAKLERAPTPTFWGRPCPTAGMFLAVRELLRRDGANVAELRPSSLVGGYALRHHEVFARQIPRLAPGRVPPIRIRHRALTAGTALHVVGMIALLATLLGLTGVWLDAPALLVAFTVFAAALACFWAWAWRQVARHPERVMVGEFVTFRDLCQEMARR